MTNEATKKSIRLSAQSTWKRMGEEIVVLDLNTGAYFTLNPTAAASWEKLVQGAPLGEIAALTAKEFNIPPDTALSDLENFLDRLQQEKIIEWT